MANSIYEMFTAGVDRGQQRKERRTLSDYLQPALAGDQQAQAAIYGANPDTGMKVEGLAQQRAQGAEKSRAERMARSGKLAAAYASNPNPLLWRQFKAEVSDIPELAQMPEDLSDPNDAKGAAELARAWAAAYGTPPEDATPSAIRELQMLQANPELAKLDMQRRQAGWRPQLFTTDQGYASYDPRTNGVSPLSYGQPQPSGMQYQTEDGQPVPPEDMAAFTAAATQGGTFAVGPGGQSVPVAGPAIGAFGGPERVKPPGKVGGALQERIRVAREMGASEAELRQMVIGREGAAAGAKPMPAAALKMIQEETNAANTASAINKSLDGHLAKIRDGKLEFGMVSNVLNKGRIAANMSTPEARNYQEFVSDLERLRNDSLRLNSGVQTDGDAQRAWNELVANLNDTQYVKQRLETIRRLNERAESLRRMNVEMIRENYGRGESRSGSAEQDGAPVRIQSAAEYNALPSGATYIAPDGTQRRKK